MRKEKRLALAALALGLAGGTAGVAQANVIYTAPQDLSNLYSNNQIGFAACCGYQPGGVLDGAFGVGNTITFAGANSFRLQTVDLFGYAGGGSKPIEVDLYSGANPNTGRLLGSAEIVPTGSGWTTEVLSFGGLQVPRTVTYVVSIVGNSGSWDDSFVNWQQFTGVSGAPTTGASGAMWYGSSGDFVVDNAYAIVTGATTNTLAVQFNGVAAPEPATWAMLSLGFVGLGWAGWRKARTARAIVL